MVQERADIVFFGGDILTMAAPQQVEAVAVQGERILATGSLAAIQPFCDEHTRMVDLAGQTLLPGFIDAHSHFIDMALRSLRVDLRSKPIGSVESIDDIKALLAERAQQTRPGDWVVGWGYDDTKLKEMRHLTKKDLDQVSTEHPIVIQHLSGWVTVSNSLALAKAGISTEHTEHGNVVILRDRNGEPTGVIQAGTCPVWSHVPKPSREEVLNSFAVASSMYLAKGCTTAQEGWIEDPEWIEFAQQALEHGTLTTRLVLYPYGQGLSLAEYKQRFPFVPAGTALDEQRFLVMGANKLAADGSIQAYTGFLSKPYYRCPLGQPRYVGYPGHDPEALKEEICALHAQGQQIAVHCNGDAAIDIVLDGYERAQQEAPRPDCRHILIHAQMAREDQVARMAKLKVIPSFFIAHIYYWGERHYSLFMGPERAKRMSPAGDALRYAIPFTIHNDTYVTPINPLLLVWTAVNRQSDQGRDLGKAEQGVPVLEALKAVTINAARQGFEEAYKGSIEQGKFADFVILKENPCRVDPMHIKDIVLTATIVGGKLVYGSLA